MESSNGQQGNMATDTNTTGRTQKQLPWFVCAAITTCLVMICYEYSEAQNDSTTDHSPERNPDHSTNKIPAKDADNKHQPKKEETDYMGRCVFNVITMLICVMAIFVTWSSKEPEQQSAKPRNK